MTNTELARATGAIVSDWGVTFAFDELDAYTLAAIKQSEGPDLTAAYMAGVERGKDQIRDQVHPANAVSEGVQVPKVSVFQYAQCNNILRTLDKPYPRTCAECGIFGPCRTGAMARGHEAPTSQIKSPVAPLPEDASGQMEKIAGDAAKGDV